VVGLEPVEVGEFGGDEKSQGILEIFQDVKEFFGWKSRGLKS